MTAAILRLDLARAHRRPVARHACMASSGAEALAVAQLRLLFAWQRVLLRAWLGV